MSNKRKRTVEVDESRAQALGFVEREETDIRASLQKLHGQLDQLGDVVVEVRGESSTSEYPCISALLGSASRPLYAMLYGPLRAAIPVLGEGRPRLTLTETEPWCFEHLLRYVHGHQMALTIEKALQLHLVADYYEVLPLRDACCRYLLSSLRPDNCCLLLSRSQDVHCEPLAQRCLDTLAMEFVAVSEQDDDFGDLDHQVLRSTLARDDLVCAEEYQVLHALVTWYAREPNEDKARQAHELLGLVRWALVAEEKRDDVEKLCTRLWVAGENLRAQRQKPDPAQGGQGTAAAWTAGDGRACWEALSRDKEARACPALETAPPPSGCDAAPTKSEAGPSEAGPSDTFDLPSRVRQLLAARCERGAPTPRERQVTWGKLVARPQAAVPGGPEQPPTDMHVLKCTKEYIIGRSRRSDIRVGHQAQMPYISSQHFRIYHGIRWPEPPPGGAALSADRSPRLSAWLEDLSQNGTFVNGKLVGKGQTKALDDLDTIELVFPQNRERVPPAPSNNSFPVFTYEAWKPPDGPPSSPPISSNSAEPGTPPIPPG